MAMKNEDALWKLFFVVLVIVILAIVLFIGIGIKQEQKFIKQCNDAGGKFVNTINGLHCIKPENFIELE